MRTINKILIANRGEVALRVIRTAADMGIASVAVYADQDMAAPFVRLADEAWGLGGTTAEETYLAQDKILEIALETGADAIHPGYGFLSENPVFARTVEDAGIAWLGPRGDVIEALGDKISARRVAEACDVAPVPGVSEPISSRAQVEEFIEAHGYPVVLKRADGGGGRGISVLREGGDVERFFARHTARPTPGTPGEVGPRPDTPTDEGAPAPVEASVDLGAHFVERFVEVARHVETQCARDSLGTFHVVSTRDCSVQRRNQKLIEEAPAPFLPDGVHDLLVESSRRLFDQVNYVGVGTVEFLLEPDGSVWFLEVNPRLQVEHPVSEEVAGIDLVREQVLIAMGLPLTAPVPPRGHSFEFRITSEDPAQELMPTAGRAQSVVWPSGPGVRLELGLAQGDEVVTAFDSMLAKIIVTGADREQALARSRRALGEFLIEGVATPVEVYQDIIDDPAFIGADGFGVSTRWLETVFLPRHDYSREDVAPSSTATAEAGTAAQPPAPRQTYVIELDGRRVTLRLPEGIFAAGTQAPHRPAQPLRGQRQERPGAPHQRSAVGADGTLASPMQAIVVQMCVRVGDHVEEGQLVAVLEAMKMEKYVQAPHAGVVTEVSTSQGASVAAGDPLLRIEKEQA